MNPSLSFSMRTIIPLPFGRGPARVLHRLLLALLAAALPARAGSWTEPDITIYGKVLNLGGGSPHQLNSGVLHFTLRSDGPMPQTLQLTTDLHAVGRAGEYSYRLSIPLFFQPHSTERAAGFSVGILAAGFTAAATYAESGTSTTQKPVTLLDRSQLEALVIAQRNRGAEFRLDLAVNFTETDSDGDGMPDWWEDAHGLGKFSAADAGQDPDHDGLTNLQEYRLGTDPQVANFDPVLAENQLSVPAGGRAGVAFTIVDRNSTADQVLLSPQVPLAGLTWRRLGQPLAIGTEFSYQAVLNGEITLEAAPNFVSGITRLRVRDTGSNSSPAVDFSLTINALSPAAGILEKPALWLDARVIASNTVPVAEWPDLSGAARDGYQPATAAQPLVRNGQARFEGGRFLYLDDKALQAPQFTAFLACDADNGGGASQTLFRSANLQLDVQTTAGIRYLQGRQSGRTTLAPLAAPGSAALYTITAGGAQTQLEAPDQGVWLSTNNTTTLPFAYSTIGAVYPLTARAPSNYFQGNLREIVLYATPLPVAGRALVQDYQLSRWEGFLVWNYRHAALPLTLGGRDEVRNSLTGGYGDDTLVGGSKGDILRGGPGRNTLTGGLGSDRFAFQRNSSQDVVTDFNADEGDVVDLTDLMDAPAGGTPPQITVTPVVTRGTNNYPRVDTLIEVRYGGAGAVVNQTIVLQNVGYLPPSALRLPATGAVPVPPTFVTVESAGSALADINWLAPIPNVVDGSAAVDRNGNAASLFQNPTAGTLVGVGSTVITLTARDDAWNTATTTTTFLVTSAGGTHYLTWGRTADGGLRFTVPPGTVLEAATTVAGPWEAIAGSGDVLITPDQPQRFFRLRSY